MDSRERRRAAARAITTPEYRRFRLRMMARDEWLCQPCLREGRVCPADQLDHIVSRAEAPDRVMDEANVQAINSECHEVKTVGELAKRYPSLADRRVEIDRRFL